MMREEKLKELSTKLCSGDNVMSNFQKNLYMYVKDAEITMRDISDKADIPFSTLNNIIYKNPKDVKLSTVVALAKALEISVDELIGANTINPITRESIMLCKQLPEHSLYLVRYFIRHQARIYANLDKHQKYISVLIPNIYNGVMHTTNIVESLCIDNLPDDVKSNVYLGLKLSNNAYMPYYQEGEIILIAADRKAILGERCVITADGEIYIVEKTFREEYINVINNAKIPANKVDDKIGYVVGFLNSDGSWGIR